MECQGSGVTGLIVDQCKIDELVSSWGGNGMKGGGL